jgi:hypothetical protein
MDLRETEIDGAKWIQLAQDRVQWRVKPKNTKRTCLRRSMLCNYRCSTCLISSSHMTIRRRKTDILKSAVQQISLFCLFISLQIASVLVVLTVVTLAQNLHQLPPIEHHVEEYHHVSIT